MNKAPALIVLTFAASLVAAEPPVVDTRLAHVVEDAAKASGVKSINISETITYTLNINMVNGRDVCDVAAAEDVRRLQDALNAQPNIKDNFGPAYFSVTQANGDRKVLTPAVLKKQGISKKCSNIYVSVSPQ
jgi:hypothetical protein